MLNRCRPLKCFVFSSRKTSLISFLNYFFLARLTNRQDQDEMPSYSASHLDPICLKITSPYRRDAVKYGTGNSSECSKECSCLIYTYVSGNYSLMFFANSSKRRQANWHRNNITFSPPQANECAVETSSVTAQTPPFKGGV